MKNKYLFFSFMMFLAFGISSCSSYSEEIPQEVPQADALKPVQQTNIKETKNGYLEITLPEDFKSGWYAISGSMFK